MDAEGLAFIFAWIASRLPTGLPRSISAGAFAALSILLLWIFVYGVSPSLWAFYLGAFTPLFAAGFVAGFTVHGSTWKGALAGLLSCLAFEVLFAIIYSITSLERFLRNLYGPGDDSFVWLPAIFFLFGFVLGPMGGALGASVKR